MNGNISHKYLPSREVSADHPLAEPGPLCCENMHYLGPGNRAKTSLPPPHPSAQGSWRFSSQ